MYPPHSHKLIKVRLLLWLIYINYGHVQGCKQRRVVNYCTSVLKILYSHKQERYGKLKKGYSIPSIYCTEPPPLLSAMPAPAPNISESGKIKFLHNNFRVFCSVRSSRSHNVCCTGDVGSIPGPDICDRQSLGMHELHWWHVSLKLCWTCLSFTNIRLHEPYTL